MNKKGFYYDMTSCVGCRSCQVACKDKNALDVGVKFRYVTSYTQGHYPDVAGYHYAGTCNHCINAACVAACPSGAMYLDEEDGTVQHDDELCIGCQYCVEACPYGIPQFIPDHNLVHKCDACVELRAAGEDPACVAACPMRALQFGLVEDLPGTDSGAVKDIYILPDSSMTDPCTFINAKPAALKEDVVQTVL